VQASRGAPEVAFLGDGDEVAEPAEVDDPTLAIAT
jgi:hypothetical protein